MKTKFDDVYDDLFKRACTGDIHDKKRFAFYCLNIRNSHGSEHTDSEQLAADFFRRAAEANDAEAQYMMGVLYREGLGRPVNLKKSEEWLKKAAESGFGKAQELLREIFPQTQFDFPEVTIEPSIPALTEKTDDNKPFSFRDLAFRRDDNGNYTINIVERSNHDYTYTSTRESGSDESEYYDSIELKTIEIDPTRDPFKDLEALIGLQGVKQQINLIQKRMEFDKKREAAGLSSSPSSNHFVFTGNPGTGKNEVARILGHILYNVGILKRGHVVEVDRAGLVAGWIGQTALKTQSAIKKARGGILFVDEAYSLFSDTSLDFGAEAIATLMKSMEDERDQFIVVMAGYPEPMKNLIASNPGLKSRIKHNLMFEDFNAQDMIKIFEKFCGDHHYTLHPDAVAPLKKLLETAYKQGATLSNGRFVRNVFERALEKMALRVINANLETHEALSTIVFTDIPSLSEMTGNKKHSANNNGDVVQF